MLCARQAKTVKRLDFGSMDQGTKKQRRLMASLLFCLFDSLLCLRRERLDFGRHHGLAAGRCVPVDDALYYRLIDNALGFVELGGSKFRVLLLNRGENFLHSVLAASFPETVVDAVPLGDENAFLG
jgi:hypothetical protein